MSRIRLCRPAIALALCAALVSGCAGGYVYDGNVGIGVGVEPDYYAPYGGYYGSGYYGGWEPGYAVAPFYYGGERRFDHGRGGDGGGRVHSFRPAPSSRPMPSLPSGGRGGGRGSRHR